MSIDLDFWKCREGVSLDPAQVYQTVCCDHAEVEGLEVLPVEEILQEIPAAFPEWEPLDALHYERDGHGSFQISAAAQAVRFDCYAMEQAEQKRFSSLMAKYGCPLYDPQLGVRFDKITAFLVDEAGEYRALAERAFSRLLPRFEILTQTVSWEEYLQRPKTPASIHYNAVIHRAKTVTKATSFLQFGSAWANRPCQCKTAQLTDPDAARRILGELLEKSMERVVSDFLAKTCYE